MTKVKSLLVDDDDEQKYGTEKFDPYPFVYMTADLDTPIGDLQVQIKVRFGDDGIDISTTEYHALRWVHKVCIPYSQIARCRDRYRNGDQGRESSPG